MKKSKIYTFTLSYFRTFAFSICMALASNSVFALGDELWSYIQNSDVKLGVITNYGAVIGYFSEISPVENFINYMDAGREIQQSYYGWDDGSSWTHGDWAWNPVQGGSYQNHKPKLLEFVNDNNMIYARSNPRNWAGCELIENCFMEEWISLEDNIAHITFRMCYSGPSNGPIKHQEIPAVFLKNQYNTLAYYSESTPWCYDNLLTNVINPPEGNQYDNMYEEWVAAVQNGWGLGVFTPGTDFMTFYRVGGSSGNEASGCTYFSPIRGMVITTNFTFEYDVYLTIGMTNEIRNSFYDCYAGVLNPSFEIGNITNWTKTGTAWDDSPATTNYLPAASVGFDCDGTYFALSRKNAPNAETAVGTLRSKNFMLKKDEQLSFLICGHSHHFATDYNYITLNRVSDDAELDRVWAPDINSFKRRLIAHNKNTDQEVYLKAVDDCSETGWAWFGVDYFNKIFYNSTFGKDCGFETGDFSGWTVAGPAFTSVPESTDEGLGIGGWQGKYYACSRKGGQSNTGSIRSLTFSCAPDNHISFIANGFSHAAAGEGSDYNYVTLNRASDNSEIDRVYMPGTVAIMKERELVYNLLTTENVYVKVVDDSTNAGMAWMAVDSFKVDKVPDIEIANKNFASPTVAVGAGSASIGNWRCKGDVGITNMSSQISPLSGQTIFINGSELFQTFEGIKLKPWTTYRLTFDSYSVGTERTIKAGIGYGISSGENSIFVAPIDAVNISNVYEGTGTWLGNDFASGATFVNVLNPSANDSDISHMFTFSTKENLDYTRISCDLGIRFWDASGSQIQLDNVVVTNFPTIPEGGILFLIFDFGFLIYIIIRNHKQ